MGKRSNFTRRKQDAYDSPPEVVGPLLSWLPKSGTFWEPCAGKGDLVHALMSQSSLECVFKSDVEPRNPHIRKLDALSTDGCGHNPNRFDLIITNPPWTRQLLHPMIDHFRMIAPTWLLFDADWMHTKQAEPYLRYCERIVSVGRVSWMQNGTSGLDNCAWYLFDKEPVRTEFNGRTSN